MSLLDSPGLGPDLVHAHFGGERIPGIWLGKLETRFDVLVGS